ncbi:sensor histidine kinase [Tistlia consotensis]|uniref:sensor histidine kinase n=1 Tax=Tistlia consotensis TaxID=1321365 RepID=UPI00135661EB|nr:ATP-binding protein [Tistlia consotensis]
MRRRDSLLARFLLILVPLFLLLAVPGIGLFVHYALKADRAVLAARLGNQAGRVAAALAHHDPHLQPKVVQDLVAGLAADRALVCAELRAAGAGVADGALLAAQPPRVGCRHGSGDDGFEVPVGDAGAYRLLVRFSTAEIRDANRLQLMVSLSVVSLAFLLAVAASTIGFRAIVGRPLRLLLEAIEWTSRTGERRSVPAGRQHELGRVIVAFNRLQARDVAREAALRAANRRLTESQAALSRLNEELERRVGQRTADLAAQTLRAETASRAKSQFLATMSHELRTPLSAIIGFAEVLAQDERGQIEPARRADYLAEIRDGGRHLLALVNDLLDMARVEGGSFELAEQEVELAAGVAAALRQVEPAAAERGLTLSAELPETPLLLSLDPAAWRRILGNLLSNAVKFTEPGGQVAVEARREPAGGLRLTVTDSGIGIAPEHLAQVLQPFGQVAERPGGEGWLARRHEGVGLGLPLAKALTELHGGSLALASTPGCGTTVTLTLPAERILAPEAEGEALLPVP